MISGSKGQKAIRACTIRHLNLGPAEHEEVAIYAVNQRIPNVRELWELLCSGAIRGYQVRGKIPFDPDIILSYSSKNETKNDKSVWTLMNYVQGGKNEKKENYCDFISISYGRCNRNCYVNNNL